MLLRMLHILKEFYEKHIFAIYPLFDEQDAARITKEETSEESKFIRLTHSRKYLIFKVRTENYLLTINALDRTIIKKRNLRIKDDLQNTYTMAIGYCKDTTG